MIGQRFSAQLTISQDLYLALCFAMKHKLTGLMFQTLLASKFSIFLNLCNSEFDHFSNCNFFTQMNLIISGFIPHQHLGLSSCRPFGRVSLVIEPSSKVSQSSGLSIRVSRNPRNISTSSSPPESAFVAAMIGFQPSLSCRPEVSLGLG